MSVSNKDIETLIQWNINCVEALRKSGHEAGAQAHTETAAMLDALRAENARLREALEDLLDDTWVGDFGEWFEDRLKQARAALEVKP
jgi:hypothetical protein